MSGFLENFIELNFAFIFLALTLCLEPQGPPFFHSHFIYQVYASLSLFLILVILILAFL